MLEFGDMDRDGLLNFDEIFRFYLAVVRFPLKKASDTAQSFLDLGDINKDGKLSIKGTNFCHKLLSCETPLYWRHSNNEFFFGQFIWVWR